MNTKNESASFPIGFLIISYPYFPRNPCSSFIKLPLQFFNKEAYQEQFKKRAETLFVSDVAMGISKKIHSKVEYLPPDQK